MRIVITKASDHDFKEFRDIADLDAMAALFEELGTVIVSSDIDEEAERQFEIYDDYVE